MAMMNFFIICNFLFYYFDKLMSTRRSYSVGLSSFTPPTASTLILLSLTPSFTSSSLIFLHLFSAKVWLKLLEAVPLSQEPLRVIL